MSRILWFHPRPWGPPRGGGDLRTRGLVQCALASGHTVGLVVPAGAHGDVAGGLRLLEYAPRTGLPLQLAKMASRHPLRSPRVSASAAADVRGAIGDFAPDLAVVSEVMSWSVARGLVPSGLPLVYDAANVETVLFRDLASRARGLVDRVTFGIDARRVARDERELLAGSRAVMAVSDEEREVLTGMAPGTRVEVIPSSVDHPDATWSATPGQDGVLFVGTLDYPPNIDAVTELAEQVLPRVRREVPARLVVVGRRPVPALRQLATAHPWVELHEDAPDLTPHYLGARCAVLPIRSGGGTKLKAYEALAYGVPLVGTPEALAGVPVRADDEVLVAADSAGLAGHATRLLADDDLAGRLGAAGRHAFAERLSWERAAREPLHRLVEDLSSSRSG